MCTRSFGSTRAAARRATRLPVGMSGCAACARSRGSGAGSARTRPLSPSATESSSTTCKGITSIGVYPLLSDETCWLLAVDFDKQCWAEDVTAFAETCRSFGVPVAVERSRSGNGAHAWFFFASPVSAGIARRMGCFLITETTSRRHQLGMESYDRLFPNQDTMPRGGFGNLIALPLQYEARNQGNTVFLDDSLEPVCRPVGVPRRPGAHLARNGGADRCRRNAEGTDRRSPRRRSRR